MIPVTQRPAGSSGRRQAVTEPSASRVVSKPIPSSQTQDPRKYQIEQLKRRFSAQVSTLQNGTTNVSFHLKPSDPDFPFELDYLDCEIQVPRSYPEDAPLLRVKNKEIPRGFSLNIEKGWNQLVEDKPGATLLALTNALDKSLESFLAEQKSDTVTLMTFKDTRHLDTSAMNLGASASLPASSEPKPTPVQVPRSHVFEESFAREQIEEARARRAQETRQLESRMGRMSLFHKSADGIVYNLPLTPKRRLELPTELQAINSVQLIIPLLYPLQSPRILLNDVESQDAEQLEEAFAARASQQSQMTLMSHLNYLTQNIHLLAKSAQTSAKQLPVVVPDGQPEQADAKSGMPSNFGKDDKPHVQVISRPPEWTFIDASDDSDDDSSDDWDSDGSDGGGAALDIGDNNTQERMTQQVESGTSISFPSIELYGIELLQVSILGINVKCERCRTMNEVTGLKPGIEKGASCKKCATAFSIKFRQELVHQNSVRGGFIDVAGCTVSDMLPSTFVPTCGRCSSPGLGLVSVRGEVTTNVCRECHGKFTFKIPEVKFLAITRGAVPLSTGPRRRQEKLGLHAGDPLPDRGACSHYKRSYRWFRFSCCSKVHPCDKCHDQAEDHINEWANRMICGWCSREQNYAVEACGFCGRSVIGKKGRGFWEGGKGTRDKTRMSRKDKRKFRRVGGTEAKKKD
ncbi:hypothetical protein JX265_000874 [Neoarthrinium moseri]|uniref:CHY-type domain-containing protein n=1 Tax=Neoarthrinium moseri TaxID=1658444 RepID=A0A9P9WWM6_9PEZI|nr:hypothetical protein JX265_000874 [Neoarthrinium moseri]